MADYDFYRNIYAGDSIPEADFPRLVKRAESQMARFRRIYTVDAEEGGETENMAVCAMAEALCNAEAVANGESGIQSVSIGTVSASYGEAAAKAVDVTPVGTERALFRAARLYVDIYAGVR